ncbi:MAG: transcription termination factor NusA, partial [Lachnospiraceae bacterium]|nr:transcription termination factor NusA [Lachnospiraceae bacterium]
KKVEDPDIEISLKDAKDIDDSFEVDDTVNIELNNKEFGRIAANSAKNVMLQLLREEERKIIYDEFNGMQKKAATGLVQRFMGRGITINLGKADAILSEKEQIKNENLRQGDRIKVFILEVRDTKRGPKIFVSRTHPDLVRCLFEEEVTEVKDGVVEIVNIAREPGNRTKIAVYSNDPDVDPVGACVGMNGTRVNAIVDELHNEKIDIIEWDENPARLIENSLSPAKVISVIADSEDKTAKVVVPDYQLSLAIGKEGQNARLAAKLTGYKIDIKSETQAREAGELYDEYYDEDEYYEEDGYYEEGEAAQEEYAAEEAPAENTEE